MVLRMKNFNILEVQWKILLLRGSGGSRKINIEGGEFETPMHTMAFEMSEDVSQCL